MAGNPHLIPIVCHLSIPGLALGLFFVSRSGDLPAQWQAFEERRQASDLAAENTRPQVGQTYTAVLDSQANDLLDREHDVKVTTSLLTRQFLEKMGGISGTAALLSLLALFGVMRNYRMTRRLRLWVLVGHCFVVLILLMLLGASVIGRQAAIRVEHQPAPGNLIDFRATGHAQIGKIYTPKRHQVLFQFLESDGEITSGVLTMFGSGQQMATRTPPLLGALCFLNLILISRARRLRNDEAPQGIESEAA